jgi:hypothetical protein
MLKLVCTDNQSSPRRNLQIARAHIETAIAHINDAAQGRIGAKEPCAYPIEDLRLLVTALADIRNALVIIDAEET